MRLFFDMNDFDKARRDRRAEIAEMDDAELAARITQLMDITNSAEAPEDDLTELGHAWLYDLQDERDRRRGYGPPERERGEDDGLEYGHPGDYLDERRTR